MEKRKFTMGDFTEKVESVIQGAKLQASRRGAYQVEDVDIFSSLSEHEEGLVAKFSNLIKRFFTTPDSTTSSQCVSTIIADIPWSQEACRVLDYAKARAKSLGHEQARIEDVLYGIEQVNGKAARMIRESQQAPGLKQQVKIHVRWMIRPDMPEVLAIEAESFEFPWLKQDFIRCLRERNCIGMVAEYDDRIVGFMIYELAKNRINVLNFAVANSWRRQGVGSQMVAKLIGKLSAQRRTRITLEVRETNLAAQLFFRASGFRAVSVLRDFYEDTPENAYLMQYRWRPEKTAEVSQVPNLTG